MSTPTGIEALVCADIARRQAHGIQKYGTTVADNPLTHAQWLQHAYEEALDLAVYLKRTLAEVAVERPQRSGFAVFPCTWKLEVGPFTRESEPPIAVFEFAHHAEAYGRQWWPGYFEVRPWSDIDAGVQSSRSA